MQIFLTVLSVLGGLSMYLFGMEVMSAGLKNASGETLSLRAEGEAAAECPFDLPRLIDYAMEQGLVLKW